MPNCNCLFLQIIRSIGTDRGTTCETKKYQTVVVQHKTVERNQSTFGPFRIRVSKVREFFYWLDWQTDWQKWVKLKEREREKDKFGERRIHFSLGFLKIKNWFFSSDLAALKNKKNLTAQECEKGKVERERKKSAQTSSTMMTTTTTKIGDFWTHIIWNLRSSTSTLTLQHGLEILRGGTASISIAR